MFLNFRWNPDCFESSRSSSWYSEEPSPSGIRWEPIFPLSFSFSWFPFCQFPSDLCKWMAIGHSLHLSPFDSRPRPRLLCPMETTQSAGPRLYCSPSLSSCYGRVFCICNNLEIQLSTGRSQPGASMLDLWLSGCFLHAAFLLAVDLILPARRVRYSLMVPVEQPERPPLNILTKGWKIEFIQQLISSECTWKGDQRVPLPIRR